MQNSATVKQCNGETVQRWNSEKCNGATVQQGAMVQQCYGSKDGTLQQYMLVILYSFSLSWSICETLHILLWRTTIPKSLRIWCFGSKPLEDRHCFEDLSIGNRSTIFLLARLRGGSTHQGMVALLRESPTTTINGVADCPVFRACPHCGTLLEHTGGCNNFTCHYCKKNFCFVCLSLGENGRLMCAGKCRIASRQTYITAWSY